MTQLAPTTSDRYSTFRTSHRFEYVVEFTTLEEFLDAVGQARAMGREYYILGNGSNTLFVGSVIKTVILKNKLNKDMTVLDEHRVEVSSSAPISAVLKHCQQNGLDSFYYLASVPATIGGALAMNAGRGRVHQKTIYDFVESVTYYDGNQMVTSQCDEIERDYRWTSFTGVSNQLIVSAVLRFPKLSETESGNKIRERIDWSKQEQDHSAPNCGSIFKYSHGGIMRRLKGIGVPGARFSRKTVNWILCDSAKSSGILWLIRIARLLHLAVGKMCRLELIKVK